MSIIDLFAGPGGWDLAAHSLGLDPIGLEWDDAACATRRAAGIRTMQCDVGAVDLDSPVGGWPGTKVTGLIASPPCQAFSMAGKGAGRGAMDAYADAIRLMADGGTVDIAALDEASGDPRGHLVLEPLRWALALHPRWIACEQVEPVLPLWEATAHALRRHGYQTWHGVVSSEQYGVPQTRRRAILLASLDGPVDRPPPTHQRYVAPRRRDEQEDALFATPEPERIVHPEDRNLLPWVSMADALGWTPTDNVGFPRRNDRPDDEGEYRERDLRPATEPAFALTEKGRSWQRFPVVGQRRSSGPGADREPRSLDEPSYTLRANAGGGSNGTGRSGGIEWVQAGTHYDARQTGCAPHPFDQPAPTLQAQGLAKGRDVWSDDPDTTYTRDPKQQWTEDRPATRVAGDPRVFQPGGHHTPGAQSENAIRVTEAQAAVLQSFPHDYPWQGTKTKRFEQIGNAVPPLLARAILAHVLAIPQQDAQLDLTEEAA